MSRAERIARYIENQYVTEQGTVLDNVKALFAEDLVYHVAGENRTREDLVEGVIAARRSPRKGRRVQPSGFEEDGDVVRWHLSAAFPDMGADDSGFVQESDLRAVFNSEDLIQEVWSEDVEAG